MATAAVLSPRQPIELQTPSTYLNLPFELPEHRFVGLLACQRDPLLRALDTRVLRCDRVPPAKGKKAAPEEWQIELSDTVCFPTGGGQPSDTGTITSQSGKKVRVKECVRVGLAAKHITDGPLEPGEHVRVEIDWERRRDLMTQHLGQHLLSAVLEQETGLDTPSWAMANWPDASYIEVTRQPTTEELERVEAICNAHIRSCLPVRVDVSLPSSDDPRPPKLPADYQGGVIRTVHIGELDSNPCCGSHPPNLSFLQSIKVFNHTTSIRGTNARLYFCVGERINANLTRADEQLRSACAPISCAASELASRISQLSEDRKALAKSKERLRSRLAAIDVQSILDNSESVVLKEDMDDDAEYLGMIAWCLLDKGLSRPVALAAQPTAGSTNGSLVVCGGDKIEAIAVALRKAFAGRFKGGGKGRIQGNLTGRWFEEDLRILKETLETV